MLDPMLDIKLFIELKNASDMSLNTSPIKEKHMKGQPETDHHGNRQI